MDKKTNTRAYEDDSRFVLPVILGGTGATNAHDACVNLEAVSIDDRGVANGVASLSPNRKVLLSELPYIPGVEEPSIDFIGGNIANHTLAVFTITNYDSQTTYDITANHGNILRVNDKIYYWCDDYIGIVIIHVNVKVFGINVIAGSASPTPGIVIPVNNASMFPDETWELDCDYVINAVNPITSVLWEISSPTHSTLNIYSDMADIDVGTVTFDPVTKLIGSDALVINDTYTIRCKVTTQLLGISDWSNSVTFVVIERPI